MPTQLLDKDSYLEELLESLASRLKATSVKSWLNPLSDEEASQVPDENLLDDIFKAIDAPDAPDR